MLAAILCVYRVLHETDYKCWLPYCVSTEWYTKMTLLAAILCVPTECYTRLTALAVHLILLIHFGGNDIHYSVW